VATPSYCVEVNIRPARSRPREMLNRRRICEIAMRQGLLRRRRKQAVRTRKVSGCLGRGNNRTLLYKSEHADYATFIGTEWIVGPVNMIGGVGVSFGQVELSGVGKLAAKTAMAATGLGDCVASVMAM